MTTITLKGNPVKTIGNLPDIGTPAPEFTLTKVDLSDIHLKDYAGKKLLLNIFPSIDTPTCAMAERRFNELATQVNGVIVLCISADLPFAQKRFCAAEKLENVMPVSVFRHPGFGQRYGVTIIDGPLSGLLSRAVVVVDTHGKVVYTEQVAEITNEPNYQAALSVIRSL